MDESRDQGLTGENMYNFFTHCFHSKYFQIHMDKKGNINSIVLFYKQFTTKVILSPFKNCLIDG